MLGRGAGPLTDGLRPGEAFALTVGQIDPETKVLTIDRAVNDDKVGPTKTGRVRTIPLGVLESVFDDLASHIRSYSDWTDPQAVVFTTSEGNMIDTDNFRSRIFGRAAKRVGLNNGVTPMALRHTAATNMVKRAEIHPAVVAETTGHSWQVLMATYVHETEEGNRKVANRLDDLILTSESDGEP